MQPPGRAEKSSPAAFFAHEKNLWQGGTDVKRKTVEQADICNRKFNYQQIMEVITIESKAFAILMEKIDGIAAYVADSCPKEAEQQQGQEEKVRRTAGKWMTGEEVCEHLEISPRTLQRYRTNRIIAFSICGKKIRYRRTDVEQFRERWMRETPDKQIDRMTQAHPLHERKYKLYGKKRGNTGKDE